MKGDIIPNGEFLYKYVKPHVFPEDQIEIPYGIFEDQELSCDWERYQKNPETSFHIGEGKNLIIRISVCEEIKTPCNPKRPKQLQPAWEQKIEHDPINVGDDMSHPDSANFSHSLIKGLKKIPITKAIAENSIRYKLVDVLEYFKLKEFEQRTQSKILPRQSVIKLIVLLLVTFILVILFLVLFS